MPVPDTPTTTTSGPVSEPGSPVYEPLKTARREDRPQKTTTTDEDPDAIPFPDLLPPRAESLMEGADDSVVTAELDRLLGDFLESLSATGEALSRATIGNDTNGAHHTAEKVP